MSRATTTELLRDLEQAVATVRRGRPVFIRRRGREAYVLMSARRYRRLMEELDDYLDAVAAEKAVAAARKRGEVPIPIEEVKRRLGL
jgi:prevent-host-death family protein